MTSPRASESGLPCSRVILEANSSRRSARRSAIDMRTSERLRAGVFLHVSKALAELLTAIVTSDEVREGTLPRDTLVAGFVTSKVFSSEELIHVPFTKQREGCIFIECLLEADANRSLPKRRYFAFGYFLISRFDINLTAKILLRLRKDTAGTTFVKGSRPLDAETTRRSSTSKSSEMASPFLYCGCAFVKVG